MVESRIVMRSKRNAALGARLRNDLAMLVCIGFRQFHPPVDEPVEGFIRDAFFGFVEINVLVHGLELALTRCMVHQRDKTNLRHVGKFVEMVENVFGRHLTPEMDQVFRTQAVLRGCFRHCVCQGAHFACAETSILIRSHA